jgi:hypothetical protein
MRERRFASRLGFHGAAATTTSTRPSVVTVRRPKPRNRQSFFTRASFSRSRPRLEAATASQISSQAHVPINGLKHQFEGEALLHLADHDQFGRVFGKGHEIASAHLAFDLQAELLKVALYGWIEVGFQGGLAC